MKATFSGIYPPNPSGSGQSVFRSAITRNKLPISSGAVSRHRAASTSLARSGLVWDNQSARAAIQHRGARNTDAVNAAAALTTFHTQVKAVCDALAPGVVTAPAPISIGTITGSTSKVKA